MRHLRRPVLLFALIAIATAVGLSGSSLSPIAMGDARDGADIAIADPTAQVTAVVPDPTAPRTGSTVPPTPEPTSAPTQPPTEEPEPTPTPEPEETPRPEPPVNTTGASIIFERGNGREVALTFDAGEGTGYTEEILEFLAEHNLKASFGITGEWAREYPELVKRMVDEGHLVINHSESHQSWTGWSSDGVPLTEDQRLDELLDAEEAIEAATGGTYTVKPYWRPPYGDYDAEGQRLLAEYGYDYTLYWTCDTVAWMGTTPDEIVEKCGPDAEDGGPGAIILMHVTQEADYLSLEGLVAAYQAEGYEFVTVEEMIAD